MARIFIRMGSDSNGSIYSNFDIIQQQVALFLMIILKIGCGNIENIFMWHYHLMV